MHWLNKLKASKKNPLGPDFSSAPMVKFSLSGKELSFLCPRHEMSGPFNKFSDAIINIYDDNIYSRWKKSKTGMSLDLIDTGWKFWDRPFGEGAIGYVTLDARLQRRDPHYRVIDSLLNPDDMKCWIITYTNNIWGYVNRELAANPERQARPVDSERDFWRYPKTYEEISTTNINGIDWFSYIVDKPYEAKRRLWHTPISEDHEVAFSFNASALGRNYYNDDHDLDGAVERTVHEFMENVHIKLG
ncbi:hypothetical protein ONV78_03315 [Hahella sp. CR1]|uniref:hypothetical protein n=1 Tax=Hahella sp. CR1 TaxID=2992807 RepID=UPI00244260D0|nr:hypothetical protein [Hahella sp. CR1]MDG9666752.1 hypothetical protein [Hahella sp. CR1]